MGLFSRRKTSADISHPFNPSSAYHSPGQMSYQHSAMTSAPPTTKRSTLRRFADRITGKSSREARELRRQAELAQVNRQYNLAVWSKEQQRDLENTRVANGHAPGAQGRYGEQQTPYDHYANRVWREYQPSSYQAPNGMQQSAYGSQYPTTSYADTGVMNRPGPFNPGYGNWYRENRDTTAPPPPSIPCFDHPSQAPKGQPPGPPPNSGYPAYLSPPQSAYTTSASPRDVQPGRADNPAHNYYSYQQVPPSPTVSYAASTHSMPGSAVSSLQETPLPSPQLSPSMPDPAQQWPMRVATPDSTFSVSNAHDMAGANLPPPSVGSWIASPAVPAALPQPDSQSPATSFGSIPNQATSDMQASAPHLQYQLPTSAMPHSVRTDLISAPQPQEVENGSTTSLQSSQVPIQMPQPTRTPPPQLPHHGPPQPGDLPVDTEPVQTHQLYSQAFQPHTAIRTEPLHNKDIPGGTIPHNQQQHTQDHRQAYMSGAPPQSIQPARSLQGPPQQQTSPPQTVEHRLQAPFDPTRYGGDTATSLSTQTSAQGMSAHPMLHAQSRPVDHHSAAHQNTSIAQPSMPTYVQGPPQSQRPNMYDNTWQDWGADTQRSLDQVPYPVSMPGIPPMGNTSVTSVIQADPAQASTPPQTASNPNTVSLYPTFPSHAAMEAHRPNGSSAPQRLAELTARAAGQPPPWMTETVDPHTRMLVGMRPVEQQRDAQLLQMQDGATQTAALFQTPTAETQTAASPVQGAGAHNGNSTAPRQQLYLNGYPTASSRSSTLPHVDQASHTDVMEPRPTRYNSLSTVMREPSPSGSVNSIMSADHSKMSSSQGSLPGTAITTPATSPSPTANRMVPGVFVSHDGRIAQSGMPHGAKVYA